MTDDYFMKEAVAEAKKAFDSGEIPVGAVVVRDSRIIGRGRNGRAANRAPLAHAEIAALDDAAKTIQNWRFDDCTLYVTLEPCVMCAGAIVQCRVAKIVYGAKDPRAGAAGSIYDIPRDPRMYHQCQVISGVIREVCEKLLRDFFAKRRTE